MSARVTRFVFSQSCFRPGAAVTASVIADPPLPRYSPRARPAPWTGPGMSTVRTQLLRERKRQRASPLDPLPDPDADAGPGDQNEDAPGEPPAPSRQRDVVLQTHGSSDA